MGYIIDFGHGDDTPRPLNYILRLRGDSTNGIYDLAGNTLTTNSCTVGEDDFIHLNRSCITYTTNQILAENEDFTITVWFQDLNLPTNGSITSGNNAYIDGHHIFFSSTLNPDFSPSLRYGDFTYLWSSYNSTSSAYLEKAVSKSNSWDSVSFSSYNDFYPDTLQYLTMTRKNGVLYGFKNGVLKNTFSNNTTSRYQYFRSGGNTPIIGSSGGYGTNRDWVYNRPFFNGRFKDFCIIKGRALWTKNFTPPSDYLPDEW